jgi:transcriptional regulator with XRE-family HTH domain
MLTEFGQRLARVRKQQGLSQTVLAEEAGLGVATLRRIESGHSGQMESWLKIMKALRMTAAIGAFLPEKFDSPRSQALSDRTGQK